MNDGELVSMSENTICILYYTRKCNVEFINFQVKSHPSHDYATERDL